MTEATDESVDDIAERMLAAIEKKEVLAAVLRMSVQSEIRRYATAVLGALALFGAGTASYVLFELPKQAAASASQLLQDRLAAELSDLTEQKAIVDKAIGITKAKNNDLNIEIVALNASVNTGKSKLKQVIASTSELETKKNALISQEAALESQLNAAKPTIEALNRTDVKGVIAYLTAPAGMAMSTYVKALPKSALVLTTGACPRGWREFSDAQGMLLIGARRADEAGKSQELKLQTEQLPLTSLTGLQTQSGQVSATFPAARAAHGTPSTLQPLLLSRCRGGDECRNAASSPALQLGVQMPSIAVSGAFGSSAPRPISRELAVEVCQTPT